METVGKRLKQLIDFEAGSLQNFCDKFGFIYNSIQPITSDKRELGVNILKKIKEHFPYVTADWLLFGIGQIDFSKKEGIPQFREVNEPLEKYPNDPTVEVFLKYFKNPNVRKALELIIKETIDAKK